VEECKINIIFFYLIEKKNKKNEKVICMNLLYYALNT
jgi:hypothetical protein